MCRLQNIVKCNDKKYSVEERVVAYEKINGACYTESDPKAWTNIDEARSWCKDHHQCMYMRDTVRDHVIIVSLQWNRIEESRSNVS